MKELTTQALHNSLHYGCSNQIMQTTMAIYLLGMPRLHAK